jgi:hypothetical protein
MPTCVNLMERFGSKYRVTFEDGYDAKGKHSPDPAMMELRGRFGTIYAHGPGTLAVMCDRHPAARKQLTNLVSCRLVQDGDHEATFVFDAERFREVAAIVKPRRKRQMTDEQRQAATERLKSFAFPSRSHATNASKSTRQRIQMPRRDESGIPASVVDARGSMTLEDARAADVAGHWGQGGGG